MTETLKRSTQGAALERLKHRTVIPVLGIPVSFESNDPTVTAAAEDAFGAWRVVEQAPRLISDVRMTFRIHVEEGDEGVDAHAPLRYLKPDFTRVILRTPNSIGIADAARRESILYATRGLVGDRQHFRYGVLEALTLAVLTKLDRQPLHAACIAKNDTALLLAGPSGSGKSTLAYAAAHAGYAVLSEDCVNVQMEPRLRVWGMPGWLHLPVEAASHFDELKGRKPSLIANGKEKLAIPVADIGAAPSLPVAQRAGICMIERRAGGTVALETLDPKALQKAMLSNLDTGLDVSADTIGECVRLLASHGGWRLHLGDDPRSALEPIGRMFEVLAGN
jgi:hypothetical protein